MRDDTARPILDRLSQIHRIDDTFDIVAVDFLDVPAKTFPLTAQIFQRHDIFGRAVNLDIIAVNEED